MNIDDLMEKLPSGHLIVSLVIESENRWALAYFRNAYDYQQDEPADFIQKPNETFTQFIQRIVENE
jgi:hypothetical protein